MLKEAEKQLKEGLIWRSVTLDDVDAALKLFNICSMDEIGTNDFTRSEIVVDWTEKDFNPETDTRAIFDKIGQMIAFQSVFMNSSQPVHPWVWGRVHPDHLGRGHGTILTEWAHQRAKQALDIVPEDIRVSIYSSAHGHFQPAKDLFENFGMQLIRHAVQMQIEMDAPPPEPTWPDGITIHPYNHPKDAEAVYRADEETFRDHFGYVQEPFEEGFEKFMHYMTKDDGFDPNLWYLAMDGDQIAGFSLNRKWSYECKDTGYIGSLGVRRPWRKRGIASALLYHSFGEFYRLGQRKVALHADASNLTGAVRLYENVGMKIFRRYDRYEFELRPGKEIATIELEN